jgi:hypothetical protein
MYPRHLCCAVGFCVGPEHTHGMKTCSGFTERLRWFVQRKLPAVRMVGFAHTPDPVEGRPGIRLGHGSMLLVALKQYRDREGAPAAFSGTADPDRSLVLAAPWFAIASVSLPEQK